MPKNRRRVNEPGAKSISIRTKHKVNGRKSGIGTGQMSNEELTKLEGKVRKRDKNKLWRALDSRGLIQVRVH